jgi:hypothetical protein
MRGDVRVAGYTYYFSTFYGTWMLISPVSGFWPNFKSEVDVVRKIRSETNGRIDVSVLPKLEKLG